VPHRIANNRPLSSGVGYDVAKRSPTILIGHVTTGTCYEAIMSVQLAESSLFIPVTEMYVDVLQGEGPTIGQLSSFIRFTGCHRTCDFCDSKHTWKPGEIVTKRLSVSEVTEFLTKGKARNVILTGGEPLLHQGKAYFNRLLDLLILAGFSFEVETEGLHVPNDTLANLAREGKYRQLRINCSPKLQNAGMGDLTPEYVKLGGLKRIYELGGIFKFVVRNEHDVLEALNMIETTLGSLDPKVLSTVWLMPEGITREVQLKRLPEIYDLATKFGVNFCPRLHVLRWDDKKGV